MERRVRQTQVGGIDRVVLTFSESLEKAAIKLCRHSKVPFQDVTEVKVCTEVGRGVTRMARSRQGAQVSRSGDLQSLSGTAKLSKVSSFKVQPKVKVEKSRVDPTAYLRCRTERPMRHHRLKLKVVSR